MLGISRLGSGSITDSTVQFVVTFNEDVSGVVAGNFTLNENGSYNTSPISPTLSVSTTGSTAAYLVTVSNLFGNGTLSLTYNNTSQGISNVTFASPCIWVGGGTGNANWSNAANWWNGVVPFAGSSLLFPNTIPTATSNDLSPNPLLVNSVEVAVGGYTLSGHSLTVTNGITVDAGVGGTTTILNAISGTGSVTMDGSGTLVLGNNNTYSGGTTVADGTLVLTALWGTPGDELPVGGTVTLGDATANTSGA